MASPTTASALDAGSTAPARPAMTGAEWFASGARAVEMNRGKVAKSRPARNVILFIGDGMGISTVTAARILEGQQQGRDGESNRLSFEQFPQLALSVTASANQQTSDSAPTATAMVCGIKANDGAISVDPAISRTEAGADKTRALSAKTILERAEARGLATGIVTTARVTHATPAVNYAHIADRDWEADADLPAGATVPDIARQLIEFSIGDGVDVVFGGGRRNFLPASQKDPEYPERSGVRKDGRDLAREWTARSSSARYIWNRAQFEAIDVAKAGPVLGLFEPSHMRYEVERASDAGGEPSLSEMTEKAIRLLQRNKKGFYLMVEAGRIDHGHHAGNAYRALTETIALSNAVKRAQSLVGDDTLIIVTADHSHTMSIGGYPSRGNPILGLAAINGVPILDALGLPYTTLSYANGPGWTGGQQRRTYSEKEDPKARAPYKGTALRPNLSDVDTEDEDYLQESTVSLPSETHGGEDVAIYARGPGSEWFRGVMEQHTIFHVMYAAYGWK
ncbi:alkaline phosphatase [Panacagrimonas perspica]|nr:alkaline phosphatase [Panacagrimonas perspica]